MAGPDNKQIIRIYFDEVVNKGNLSMLDQVAPGKTESLRQAISMFIAAFPDARTVIDDIIGEGDKVVVRSTTRATHKGALMGIQPTGRPVRYAGVDIFRLEDGRIVEHWFVRDHLTLMEQLGVLPKFR
jgi:predicted ester cyclase